jgi:hypothetical protein
MSLKSSNEPNNGSVLLDTELRRPFSQRRYFRMAEVALRLARLPGRMERDEDEALRILGDLIAWYKRGEFAEHEVVVFIDDPLGFISVTPRLDEVESLQLWRDAVMLTRDAVERYLDGSSLGGARRLRHEWFSRETSKKGKPGPKADIRKQTASKMLADLMNHQRTLEELNSDTLEALVSAYGSSGNTAKLARKDAVADFKRVQK